MNKTTPPTPVVYVASDEPSLLDMTSCLLCKSGLMVETVAPANRLIDWPLSEGYGCIVLCTTADHVADAMELHRAIARARVARPVIFIAGTVDIATAVSAMKQGAFDFLVPPAGSDDLIRVVRNAIEADRAAWRLRGEAANVRRRLATLTPREREVFLHVISGRLNKQTAAELGTVEKTIKVHRAHVMEKLDVSSLADLVRLAERADVAPLPPAGGYGWPQLKLPTPQPARRLPPVPGPKSNSACRERPLL